MTKTSRRWLLAPVLTLLAGAAVYHQSTTIAAGDGSRQPSAIDLDGARYQGKRIAETAAKLKG